MQTVSEFVGVWRQEMPDDRGNLGKTDFVICEESGDRLTGSIRRLLPESERFKRWHFEARIQNGVLFGLFWPWSKEEPAVGYGFICLNRVDDRLLQGFLVELNLQPPSTEAITRPVSWVRG